jgi:hypothetical protein
LLDVGARNLAGDPADIILRRRNLAVQGERRFHGNQRAAGLHEMNESLIETFRGGGMLF